MALISDSPRRRGRLYGILRYAVDVEPAETAALLFAFAYFFCLLSSYYLLRPLRDAMGLVGGVQALQWLFTATFLTMLALVPVFGFIAARLPPRRFVPLIYRFFALNLVAFGILLAAGIAEAHVARVFFVWMSVFNLFVVAIFWSVLADCFRNEQGRRLFGFIAAGGTAGALVGPALAGSLVTALGPVTLTFVAAALLEAAVQCFRRLVASSSSDPSAPLASAKDADEQPWRIPTYRDTRIGGGILAGLSLLVRSRYLFGIVLYMLFYTMTSTFLYFEQARIVAERLPDTASRTQVFAAIDFVVSGLTLVLQVLVTGRFMRRFGVAAALIFLPAVTAVAFVSLAAWPALSVLIAAQGIRRAVDYAIARPGREVLFTVVDREAKYKAKNAIETFIYRGGDAASGWAFTGLAAAGLGLAGFAVLSLPLAALWAALAFWLGRRQDQLAQGAISWTLRPLHRASR